MMKMQSGSDEIHRAILVYASTFFPSFFQPNIVVMSLLLATPRPF